MFKKSIFIVIIQIIGSILGLLNIYLIAGDMEPQVYSLVGVYTVISGITLTFSDLGIETVMMREALYWIENEQNDKVVEHATQALVSRTVGYLILLPLLGGYVFYLSRVKYSTQYHVLLILFLLGGFINALNNSMTLIVRSKGDYVFSQIASTTNNYFIKFAGIGLYLLKGEMAYLYFYSLSSVPLFLVYIIRVRKELDYKQIKIKETILKIWKARYLWLKTDLDYFKNNADSIIVSTFFSTSIMGAYTIYKSLEQIAKNFIEGFFDVLSQNMVKYKGNKNRLQAIEKKIKLARNIIIAIIFLVTIVFGVYSEQLISIIHLQQYNYIAEMIICVAIVSLCYLIGKYEINTLAFFATSKLNFKMGIFVSLISLGTFVLVIPISTIYGVLLQRILAYLSSSVVAIVYFKKYKKQMYTEILE